MIIFSKIKEEYDKTYNEELNKTGIFWAFSNDQFNENKTHKDAPDNEYHSIGYGGYIHKSNIDKYKHFIKDVAPKLKADFVSKINIDDLIKYELINHECYYTGDYSEVEDIVSSYYDMSKDEIHNKVKNVYMNKNIDDLDSDRIGI